MSNNTMMIDFYEFTMAQTYFDKGEQNKKVYFDIFFRKNLKDYGYTIMAGLDEIIDYIENFKITEEDIAYLKSTNKFTDEFLDYLRNIRFTGDIFAVPDGVPIFPNEPVLTVRANVIEAQLLETALLACFNYAAALTTTAKRIANVAGVPVMEFGARRARGLEGANLASKYSYMGGFCGTSNVRAAIDNGIPALGTMAHSLICDAEKEIYDGLNEDGKRKLFYKRIGNMKDKYNLEKVDLNGDAEYLAFLEYSMSNPDNCLYLVDTFDTLRKGVPNAIKVANDFLVPNGLKFKGVRIDSGDLAYLSTETQKILDAAGFEDAGVCLSNDLDAETIESLKAQKAIFKSLGVGTKQVANDANIGGVYKLVAIERNNEIIPRIKVSNDSIKTINPGYKRVYRFYDKNTNYALGDVVALYDEVIPLDEYTLICPTDEWKQTVIQNYYVRELQVPIYMNGKLIYKNPTLQERQQICNLEFNTLYPEIQRLKNPAEYYVDLSRNLLDLKKRMIYQAKGDEGGKAKVRRIEQNPRRV